MDTTYLLTCRPAWVRLDRRVLQKSLTLGFLACVGAAVGAWPRPAAAQPFYWACASGAWDPTVACWSSTLGGSPVSSPPGNGDDAFLEATDGVDRTVTYATFGPTGPGLNSLTIDDTGTGTMTLNQSGGSLTVANGADTANEIVGNNGTGSFIQSGGTNTVGGTLTLGSNSGSSGSYTLSGTGSLTATNETIGFFGAGAVTQSGSSTNTVGSTLTIGSQSGANGSYTLSGGNLSVGSQIVGGSGVGGQASGTLTINGGTLSVGGGYGSINVGFFNVGDAGQSGSYTQIGGSTTVSNALTLGGVSSAGTGNYTLSGGGLDAGSEIIGTFGTGTFTQTGGLNNVENIEMGYYSPPGAGTYNLSGGELIAQSIDVGDMSPGTFVQSGGTNSVGILNVGNGGSGSYTLSGGGILEGPEIIGNESTGTFTQNGARMR